MNITTALKLMAKKYPETKENYLGAMLVFYDDGGGFIRGTGRETRDYASDHLFEFSTLEQLENHLRTK